MSPRIVCYIAVISKSKLLLLLIVYGFGQTTFINVCVETSIYYTTYRYRKVLLVMFVQRATLSFVFVLGARAQDI